jgi:hypothetical protein
MPNAINFEERVLALRKKVGGEEAHKVLRAMSILGELRKVSASLKKRSISTRDNWS